MTPTPVRSGMARPGDSGALPADQDGHDVTEIQLVTMTVADQLFGLPIDRVRDVFIVQSLTPVPLAPPAVAGLFNLRGKVVTTLSLRSLFGHPPVETIDEMTAVGIEWRGESFGLLIDEIGEVLRLPIAEREGNPAHIDQNWARFSAGVHRLKGRLLVELDLDALLDRPFQMAA